MTDSALREGLRKRVEEWFDKMKVCAVRGHHEMAQAYCYCANELQAALLAATPATQTEGAQADPDPMTYPPALQRLGARLTELLDDDQWNNIEPLLHEVGKLAPASPAPQREARVTPEMMSTAFAASVHNTDPEHPHLYDHRIASEILNDLLAAERATPTEKK